MAPVKGSNVIKLTNDRLDSLFTVTVIGGVESLAPKVLVPLLYPGNRATTLYVPPGSMFVVPENVPLLVKLNGPMPKGVLEGPTKETSGAGVDTGAPAPGDGVTAPLTATDWP